jgi:hypothetical protein
VITLAGGVAPFGDPGINDRSHLPRAFRSVPRPSSPLSAKASTRCPCFALDPKRPRPAIAQTGRPPAKTPRKTAAHRGKPHRRSDRRTTPPRPSHEDTFSDGTRAQARTCARGPSASVTFTNPFHPSINTGPETPAAAAGSSPPGRPEPRNQTWSSPNAVIGRQRTGDRSPPPPRSAVVRESGGERDRTDDLLLAKQALSQLSYTPLQRSEIRTPRSEAF